jgi:hypothetical protein
VVLAYADDLPVPALWVYAAGREMRRITYRRLAAAIAAVEAEGRNAKEESAA